MDFIPSERKLQRVFNLRLVDPRHFLKIISEQSTVLIIRSLYCAMTRANLTKFKLLCLLANKRLLLVFTAVSSLTLPVKY